jgi:hypothetical protein
MLDNWPEEIKKAQEIKFYKIGKKNYKRIPYYGEEPCHDCMITNGQLHVPGCDIEICPVCEVGQNIGCDCLED